MSAESLPKRLILFLILTAAVWATTQMLSIPFIPTVTADIGRQPLTIAMSTVGRFAAGNSWYLSINSAGQAELTIDTIPHTTRQFEISPEQRTELMTALEKEQFFELKDDYGELVPDGSTTTVTIVSGAHAKTVRTNFLMNWVHTNKDKLREPSRALRISMLIRSWFDDAEAVDLTKYDQVVLDAIKD